MNKDILISVEQVSHYYGDSCAVDNISFAVNRGEVLGFLGPNGAGKTTTMQIISGVLLASAGTVTIAGFDIIEKAKSAKTHIGFLPEHPPLYHDLTVDEYLRYAAQLRGLHKSTIPDAIESSKQRCGLGDVGGRLIGNLSKGFQQRVGIAQAIIHSPAVVILDEPTVGLDPIQILEIRDLINELGKDHSVILSTHILPEVQSVCDRVLIINEGKLVLDQRLDSLHQDKHKISIRVAFKKPPAIETILAISGVTAVELIDDQRFLINFDPNSETTDKLTQQAATSCWGLFEMIPETDSLEETFLQLTSGGYQKIKQDSEEIQS
ncbi:MAG: ATP-binding cassette domain-containing protein [Gammaproteobacteria bacterium]